MQIRAHHIKWGALALTAAAAIVGLYFLMAYIVLPLTWRHYEHQQALAGVTMITRTADGVAGNQRAAAVAVLDNPPLVAMKNLAWDAIAKTMLSVAMPRPKK